MPRPYPDIANATGSLSIVEHANNILDGWLVVLFLMAALIALFLVLKQKQYRTSDSFLIASFGSFMLSSMCWAAGLIQGKIVVLFIIFVVMSALYSMFEN